MSFIKNFFLILILLYFPLNVLADNNIYYIDVDYIVKNSNKGKMIISELEKIKQTNLDNLNKEQAKLIDLEKDIKKKKNIINDDELKKKITELNEKINNFNNKKVEINKEFKTKRDMKLNNFFAKLETLVQNYVKEKSIDLLINKKSIFIGKSSYDVTNEVINIVNQKIK